MRAQNRWHQACLGHRDHRAVNESSKLNTLPLLSSFDPHVA
jgi:hypothetical protein